MNAKVPGNPNGLPTMGTRGGARPGAGRKKGETSGELIKRLRLAKVDDCVTETEARERFRILNEHYGFYDVIMSQEGYPDFILEKGGKELRAEVELKSRNFKTHKHPKNGCDFVICWLHDYPELPVPVFELKPLWVRYLRRK